MKYKAIFADVDGTLIAPASTIAPLPERTVIKKVTEAIKRGIIFSLATARSLDSVSNLIDGFGLKDFQILDNGALIYDADQKIYIFKSLLNRSKTEQILEILKGYKAEKMIIMDNFRRLYDPSKITDWKISKLVFAGLSPLDAEKIYQELIAIKSVQVTKSISGTGFLSESIHVTNEDAVKSFALLKIMKMKGLVKEEVIGIGDSYNDLSFMKECGLKIAMGNAIDKVKAVADYIAPSYADHGVAEIIDRFIL